MKKTYRLLIYSMAFLSGSAALLYEVCWFRSLGLVLGGTQFAATTTVSVFMMGLALGNWLAARHMHRFRRLLFLYGLLEIGIALFAVIFLALLKVYPRWYVSVAAIAPQSLFLLTTIRVLFAAAVMIAPATLMGATLPVLTNSVSKDPESLPDTLSFLYGSNTLGAVLGAAVTGFVLLRSFPVSTVMLLAAAVNVAIGMTALAMQRRTVEFRDVPLTERSSGVSETAPEGSGGLSRLILWGIGVSGFCALGYEVLWTRILTLFLGATVYSFTVMLVAFLLGIGLGSSVHGLLGKGRRGMGKPLSLAVTGFGLTQVLIGVTTLLVMRSLLDIPAYSVFLQHLLSRIAGRNFVSFQTGNFIIAFSFLALPAFLMGFAMPLAGRVHSGWGRTAGRAAGELLTFNTVGAILGAAVSGFVLLYLFGIERSFQILCLINICVGGMVLAGRKHQRIAAAIAVVAVCAGTMALFLAGGRFRFWDRAFLATYTPDQAALFRDDERSRQQIDNHTVLYYAEGFDAIVSSTLRKDTGTLQFSVNGRPEASTNLEDMQNQYMLGHLPMLLHRHPRKALVIGAGSGLTLAAVASHPELEELHLVEIEPKVLGVARAFGAYNHHIIDNPALETFFEDARNYLMATKDRFDVITADPIHPIWRGSGYLYTSEYFRLAAQRLEPGGVMCQWVPLYLLSPENVRSIVRTFRRNFAYVMVWMTMDDVQLVGSNSPLVIDRADMARRIAAPAVQEDLREVFMGSVEDLCSYFVTGNRGVAAFARGAVVNTDDNVYLEFSSPEMIAGHATEARNVSALAAVREDLSPYLARDRGRRSFLSSMQQQTTREWSLADRAQILYLSDRRDAGKLDALRKEIEARKPSGRLKSLAIGLFGYQGY